MSGSGLSRFTDSVVIVTGSTRGIGAGITERFAAEGASVVVTGRSTEDGEQLAADIRSSGGEAVFVELDVSDPEQIQSLVETTTERWGEINHLVNNAAVQSDTGVTEISIEEWNRIVDVNFRGYWLTVKSAAEHMPAGSTVVNVSSNHAYQTMPDHFPYNAVKGGINAMTRAMAIDLSSKGIRVNSVSPGWVLVDRTAASLLSKEQEYLESIHPVGRLGRPEDVAGAVLWLASDDAAYVTGTDILVDGGRGAVMQDDTLLEERTR